MIASDQGNPAVLPRALQQLGVASSKLVKSTISTNTTNHTGSSNNPLTTTEVAAISAGVVVAVVGVVLIVLAGLAYNRRKNIAELTQLLSEKIFSPTRMFTDGTVRPVSDTVDENEGIQMRVAMDIDERGDGGSERSPHPYGMMDDCFSPNAAAGDLQSAREPVGDFDDVCKA